MFTICTNDECKQKFKISEEMIGLSGRCKKCNTIFKIEEYEKPPKVLELEIDSDDWKDANDKNEALTNKKRRSSQEIMQEEVKRIIDNVNNFIPRLNNAFNTNENESGTRLLIDKMLQNILGYRLEDIKTEMKIEGRRADYVLSIGNEDVMVVEAKKIGMTLKERQIFQATSYGAYAGIKWVLLTNALVWQLYHVSIGEKIETDLIFTIDLKDGLDKDEATNFYLISKVGMSRKNLLDNLWKKMSALCYDNIVNVILTDQVITRIRGILTDQTGCNVTNDELRTAIEENIFQLG